MQCGSVLPVASRRNETFFLDKGKKQTKPTSHAKADLSTCTKNRQFLVRFDGAMCIAFHTADAIIEANRSAV
jgi:hypothetical protein